MVDGKAMRMPSDSLEGLGFVIWVIVGAAGSTGLAILVILFVVLNRNRKKTKGNSRLADDINGDRRLEENC
jgi:hypothetical protein